MNKLLIIFALILALPAYSTCSIENDFVCSLPEIRQSYTTNFSPSNVNTGSVNSGISHPLQNSNVGNSVRDFSGGSNGGYNSNCQFGVCLPDRNRPLFLQNGSEE